MLCWRLDYGSYMYRWLRTLLDSIEELLILMCSSCSYGIALMGLNFGAGGGGTFWLCYSIMGDMEACWPAIWAGFLTALLEILPELSIWNWGTGLSKTSLIPPMLLLTLTPCLSGCCWMSWCWLDGCTKFMVVTISLYYLQIILINCNIILKNCIKLT